MKKLVTVIFVLSVCLFTGTSLFAIGPGDGDPSYIQAMMKLFNKSTDPISEANLALSEVNENTYSEYLGEMRSKIKQLAEKVKKLEYNIIKWKAESTSLWWDRFFTFDDLSYAECSSKIKKLDKKVEEQTLILNKLRKKMKLAVKKLKNAEESLKKRQEEKKNKIIDTT